MGNENDWYDDYVRSIFNLKDFIFGSSIYVIFRSIGFIINWIIVENGWLVWCESVWID